MKEKIYLKALTDTGLMNIDLDVIKKDIFKGINANSEWTYLFTIVFFTKDDTTRPLIRKVELPFLDGNYDDDEAEDLLYEILDAVNHLSSRPIYAITKQNFSQDGEIWCDDDNSDIFALRDCKGDIIKEFIIKF